MPYDTIRQRFIGADFDDFVCCWRNALGGADGDHGSWLNGVSMLVPGCTFVKMHSQFPFSFGFCSGHDVVGQDNDIDGLFEVERGCSRYCERGEEMLEVLTLFSLYTYSSVNRYSFFESSAA